MNNIFYYCHLNLNENPCPWPKLNPPNGLCCCCSWSRGSSPSSNLCLRSGGEEGGREEGKEEGGGGREGGGKGGEEGGERWRKEREREGRRERRGREREGEREEGGRWREREKREGGREEEGWRTREGGRRVEKKEHSLKIQKIIIIIINKKLSCVSTCYG